MTYSEQFLQPVTASLTPTSGAMVDQPKQATIVSPKIAEKNYTGIQTGYNQVQTDLQNQQANNQQSKLLGDQRAASELTAQEYADRAGVDISRVQGTQGNFMIGPESKATDLGAINAKVDSVLNEGQTPEVKPTAEDNAQAAIDAKTAEFDAQAKETQTKLQQVLNGTFPLTVDQQSQLTSTQQAYQQLIDTQTIYNQNYTGGITNIGISRGLSRYAPELAQGSINESINQGVKAIADLNGKMASALSSMKEAFRTENYNMIRGAWDQYNESQTKITEQLQKVHDDIVQAQKDVDTATKDAKKEQYDQVTKPIQDIALEAAKNFATPDVIAAINSAQSVEEAINAAGSSLTTATGALGEYLQYKRDATAAGQTPTDYSTYKIAEETRLAKAKQAEAYSSAYASTAGKLAAEKALGPDVVDEILVDPTSKSILAQTGLSIPAFSFLTKGVSALTRMTAAQRLQYMNEAENWANTKGIDISTFQSQYSALGKTVEANSLRNNQAAVAEAELDATLSNLKTAADESAFGSMRWANVAKLFAGKEFNDKNVSKYAFHLNQLREEFAMYNAALAGQIDANGNIREITGDDRAVAENIIKDGFAAGSLQGFEEALSASRDKMKTVLESSIQAQNKGVWKLFGVDQNYQNTGASLIEQTKNDTQAISDYDSQSITNHQRVEELSKIAPDATPSEIRKQLGI